MAYTIRIKGTDVAFKAEPGEKILDAAERAGIELPRACRSGFCQCCKAKVESGEFLAYAPGSKEGKPASGTILTCTSTALSDAVIDVPFKRVASGIPAKVVVLEKLAPDVIRLVLKPESGEPAPFNPGQFIDVFVDGARRSYSIACDTPAPGGYELHVRHVPGGLFTDRLFGVKGEPVKLGDTLQISEPAGDFRLRKRTENDIVFLMTGTGFAPAKAMIEGYINRPSATPHEVWLYWGGKTEADLYLDALCRKWDAENEWFHYCPVLSRAEGWTGRKGHVQDAFLADHPDASKFDAYFCGSPRLVSEGSAAVIAAGANPERIFGDAFTSKADA